MHHIINMLHNGLYICICTHSLANCTSINEGSSSTTKSSDAPGIVGSRASRKITMAAMFTIPSESWWHWVTLFTPKMAW